MPAAQFRCYPRISLPVAGRTSLERTALQLPPEAQFVCLAVATVCRLAADVQQLLSGAAPNAWRFSACWRRPGTQRLAAWLVPGSVGVVLVASAPSSIAVAGAATQGVGRQGA